jgi:mannose-6-phosphate isomerase-like protein (cupin superfamily)
MRILLAVLLLTPGYTARAEIQDVLKSAEIDRMFARAGESLTLHEKPNFSLVLRVAQGKPKPAQAQSGVDEVWFVRRGKARVKLGTASHEAGAGDVVHVPRGTAFQIDPGAGRFEYLAVRVFPAGGQPLPGGFIPSGRMPDVVKKSAIDTVFATAEKNQPLHAGSNFTVNYVIYKGRSGPFEAHRGCVDIYFLHDGTATAQLGGVIANPKEETPGEIRGDAVSGPRPHKIGPGDVVLIPRNTAHHMIPDSGKLGYMLMKVWAE